jgi:hypothetical protein
MERSIRSYTVAFAVALVGAASTASAGTPSPAQGQWQFTFSGQDSGHGAATVDAAGSIVGSGHSDTFGYDLTVSGAVAADGTMKMTAVPAGTSPSGSTSSGALFNGHADGDRAAGSWQNAEAHMSGNWTGVRGPGGGGTNPMGAHCTIAGAQFDAAPPYLYADAVASPKDGNIRFRVLLGDPPSKGGTGNEIEAKTERTGGPGTFSMSTAPLWKSTALIGGRKVMVDQGQVTLTAFEKQNASTVKGSLSFTAGGKTGQCTFNIPMQFMDPYHVAG